MSKKHPSAEVERRARYEYRVWGAHRTARKKLERMATERSTETVDDCYFLVGDSTFNAKVRHNRLKIKELIAENKGFERWASDRHDNIDDVPEPFDELFDQLRLDRPQRGKSYSLRKAVKALDASADVRAVFVTKHRQRYRIGELRAEVTDIVIHDTGDSVRTLSIEGEDLDELVELRKQLGLRGEPNVAVHEFIDALAS